MFLIMKPNNVRFICCVSALLWDFEVCRCFDTQVIDKQRFPDERHAFRNCTCKAGVLQVYSNPSTHQLSRTGCPLLTQLSVYSFCNLHHLHIIKFWTLLVYFGARALCPSVCRHAGYSHVCFNVQILQPRTEEHCRKPERVAIHRLHGVCGVR